MKPSGLGRGLDALIDTSHIHTGGSSSISEVDLSLISANPDQPRRSFDEQTLTELADSIREHGVISPITLRKNDDGTYLIIAGERRYRAAKKAGLSTIPAYIKTAKDEQVMEMALIENIQREDLDAIEIALAYQRLIDDYHLTQDRMAQRVGKKRATVANYLRLLKLPAEIQLGLKQKQIDMGHARALLAADSPTAQLTLYKRILEEGLSVRKVEDMVAQLGSQSEATEHGSSEPTAKRHSQPDERLKAVEQSLTQHLDTKVAIAQNNSGKGKLTIYFSDDEQLARIIHQITQ